MLFIVLVLNAALALPYNFSCEDHLTDAYDAHSDEYPGWSYNSFRPEAPASSGDPFRRSVEDRETKWITEESFAPYLGLLPRSWQAEFHEDAEAAKDLRGRLSQALDPFTTAGRMNPRSADGVIDAEVAKKFALFTKLTKKCDPRSVSLWADSAEAALYVYQRIDAFGSKRDEVFEYLLKHNRYFMRAVPVRGPPATLQTFSFEKETPDGNAIVGYLWRPASVTEEQWFAMSDEKRMEALANYKLEREVTVPTTLGNALNGRLRFEGYTFYEFSHPSFEFDVNRIEETALALARDLKETHSFHFHQVFDLSTRDGMQIRRFKMWHKVKADYLYFISLEHGLHGTYHTGLAAFPTDSESLPIDKFQGLGLRQGKYGGSTDTWYFKVGLEYRDVLRDLPQFFSRILRPNIAAVAAQEWNTDKAPLPSQPKKVFWIPKRSILTFTAAEKRWIENPKIPESFWRVADLPEAVIPLLRIERAKFFDYKRGEYYAVSERQRQRLQEARTAYIKDLRLLAQEFSDSVKARKPHEHEDVATALKMVISDWAKRAKVSEIYERVE